MAMKIMGGGHLMRSVFVASLLVLAALGGCTRSEEAVVVPPAAEVVDDATGYYCGMLLIEHEGPKSQIHLASRKEPVWFSSVRDAITFMRLPEEPRDITAVYVNDMGRSSQWEQPDRGTWIDARTALFVIESDVAGGMGAPEAVPFSDQAAAEKFRSEHGGRIVRLDEIPDAYVIGPVPEGGTDGGEAGHGHGPAGH